MDDPTLLIHWLFSWITILIMCVRLAWRKLAKQDFNLGDYLTMAAIVCALTRLGLIHVVLIWGTSNIPPTVRESHDFTDREIYQRVVGSKCSIANRFIYNSYLWIQKLVLLDIYRRLMSDLPYEKITIRSFLFVFLATYVAVQVTNVSECKPVSLYWQVIPDPGPCAEAQVQLVALGVLNIFTDIMLLILPIPVMVSWNTSWMRKIKLYILFMLGIFIVAITLIRLPINALNKDSQVNRTTWASTELLTAGIVVNAPTLYGLWNMRRQQQRASQTYTHDYSSRSGQREFWHSDAHGMWAHARAGDSDDGEAYAMQSSRVRRADGILQTKELTVSEVRSDDAEGASVHSSQRGILKD